MPPAPPEPAAQPPTLGVALAEGAARLGQTLDARQQRQLLDYCSLLQRWNQAYNLTAIRDPQAVLTQHLLDCLALVPALQRRRVPTATLLDVGSGGGLPGVVLAVALPAAQVTCVDAVGKKAAFVQQVAGALGLPNLRGLHRRVESMKSEGGGFDVVTARAFSSLAELVRLTQPLLSAEGCWLAMKGQHPSAELAQLPAGVEVFHVERLAVPGLDAERHLVWMRSRSPTIATGN